jgi:hypothetical protein
MGLPVVVSLAAFDGWTIPLLTLGMYVMLEAFSEYLIEPVLFSSRTGVSTLAILGAALFWGWLWGPVGLVLATPLTVCLVVLGRYIAPMRFLTVMLSDEPGLSPEIRLYHRLLSFDDEAAITLARKHVESSTPASLYEDVLLPLLTRSELDRHRGLLDEVRARFVHDTLAEVLDALGEEHAGPAPTANGSEVLCVPARDRADELAARMLVHLLRLEGVRCEAISVTALTGELLNTLEERQPSAICICAVPPDAERHARYRTMRIRERMPDVRIVAGFWPVLRDRQSARLRSAGVASMVTNLRGAVEQLRA